MTAIETDDLAVVTGPLTVGGFPGVYLEPGEVVRVLDLETVEGVEVAYVLGYSTDLRQTIDLSSLTPMDEIYEDPDAQWGDLIDPENIHDFVYEGE